MVSSSCFNALGTINHKKSFPAHRIGAKVLMGPNPQVILMWMFRIWIVIFGIFCTQTLWTPLGVLYGKRSIRGHATISRRRGMIKEVTFKTTYNEIPFKFEAGTPNIADVIAFKSTGIYHRNRKTKHKKA